MVRRISAFDWSTTPLGSAKNWSPALRNMVVLLLESRFPLMLWWGTEHVSLYNDACRPVLGSKHPAALGQPASESWKDIWQVLGPLVNAPFHDGPASGNVQIPVAISQHGFIEEAHFTIGYRSVPDDTVVGGIGGVVCTAQEVTAKVIGERRLKALNELEQSLGKARTVEEVCRSAASTLAAHSRDIPFAVLYLLDANGQTARLAARTAGKGDAVFPASIELATEPVWPIAEVIRAKETRVYGNLPSYFGAAIPSGPWPEETREMVLLPLRSGNADQLAGVLVLGASPRLALNEPHHDFHELIAEQVVIAIGRCSRTQ